MHDYSKVFFSESRAKKFIAETLEANGVKDYSVTSFLDAFDQTQYRVSWNI